MGATADTPRAKALCAALREARLASGIGLRELARKIQISHTDLSLWENGRRVPRLESVVMVLTAIGTPAEERNRIIELARNVRERNWLTVGVEGISHELAGVIECERSATAITEWSPAIVPGLLQVPEYTRATMQAAEIPPDDVDIRVMVRAGRCEVITRHDPVEYVALLDEAALYEAIGSLPIRVHQLRHLREMAERPNITVQIVPARIGWHPGLAGPFVLYDFPDTPPVVYLEHYSSAAFIPTKHDVERYRKAADKLRAIAMTPADSSAFVAKVIEEMEDSRE
jgi:transcriptional regulator with XRE-family HTH domain